MDIPPVGAELFHAHEQTDMTKLTVAFCNFTKAPKNVHYTRLVLCIRWKHTVLLNLKKKRKKNWLQTGKLVTRIANTARKQKLHTVYIYNCIAQHLKGGEGESNVKNYKGTLSLINGIYYSASGGLLISKPGTYRITIVDQRRPLKYTHKQHQNKHLRTEKNYRRKSTLNSSYKICDFYCPGESLWQRKY